MNSFNLLNPRMPLWSLGFRPFFLFSALVSVILMFLWLAFFLGLFNYSGYLPVIVWHAHEMIFGFTSAVIAGFVLTATQNWSGQRGIHGGKLQFLVLIWLIARVLILSFSHASWVSAAIDLVFYPLLSFYVVRYLRGAELRLERVLLVFFFFLFLGNLLVHLESLGFVSGWARRGNLLGLYTAVLLIVFLGGRLIPFFTESSIARAQPKTNPLIEVLSHLSTVCFICVQIFFEFTIWSALISFLSAVIHFLRMKGWYVPRVKRAPLIWVLYIGYFFVVLGFCLTGISALGLISAPLSTHAFAVGALGIVMYGMMTRVSLGHTGRRLIPPLSAVVGYVALTLGVVVRVLMPAWVPDLYRYWILISGFFWIVAFILFLFSYGRFLIEKRVDDFG